MSDWRPIETAPRDGSVIEVADPDEQEGPYEMRWNMAGFNPLVQAERGGIWEDPRGNFTWDESRGFGPTHWRPAPAAGTRVVEVGE